MFLIVDRYDCLICSNICLYKQLMQEVLKVQEWMNAYMLYQQNKTKDTATLLHSQSLMLKVHLSQAQELART